MVWSLLGNFTCSRLQLNCSPKVRFTRLLGKFTCSRLRLNCSPKVKVWRRDGKVTFSKLWSNKQPKVKLWRLLGKVTCSRLWSKLKPNVKLWRLFGRVRWSSLWLNSRPKVKCKRPLGTAKRMLWLPLPSPRKVKFWRLRGKCSKYWPHLSVANSLTPSNASLSSAVGMPRTKNQASAKFIGRYVQEIGLGSPFSKMPCCSKEALKFSSRVPQCTFSLAPAFGGSCSTISLRSCQPVAERGSLREIPSPWICVFGDQK